ncbi:unnamed protein product [Rotaria sp. Silwood1]|nr:unnamed protein product [Rotaria sp. Silwood1]CAF4724832.1 unnamed protein product [Rotaria sp. Silwood1]
MTNNHSNIESLRTVKSNEQRLKSLDEYEREKQNKKRLIKESLNNQSKTKHLKFDSDNEDDQPKEFVEKKFQLFDDNEILNVDEHFNQKSLTKKKKKLQDLQARLTTTNDPRFKLSEQFLDDHHKTVVDDDEDDNDNDNDNENNNDISIEEEKKNSLAILDQITNAKSSISNIKSSIAKPKTKMIRFDPSKTEHRIYELDSEIGTSGDNFNTSEDIKPKSILKQTKEAIPIIDSTRTYEFDETKLKSMFNKTSNLTSTSSENGGFQFQFFNNNESVTLPTPKISSLPKPIPNGKSKIFLNKADDTSSDEDDNEKPSLSEDNEIKDQITNETFFFFDIDDRLKDGLESFVRTEDLNELERTWPTKRKEIGEALRTKHRKAIQWKDKHRVFNHRRRQKQYSKSNID